jgi:hypothetical protein
VTIEHCDRVELSLFGQAALLLLVDVRSQRQVCNTESRPKCQTQQSNWEIFFINSPHWLDYLRSIRLTMAQRMIPLASLNERINPFRSRDAKICLNSVLVSAGIGFDLPLSSLAFLIFFMLDSKFHHCTTSAGLFRGRYLIGGRVRRSNSQL